MAWPKGKPRLPNAGRRKGTPNKVTRDFRQALTRLLNASDLDEMFADVPAERRLEVLGRLAEYVFPKAPRAVELTGKDGESLTIEIVKQDGENK